MNKDNYHEQGNIIIILLLLPLGHISINNTSVSSAGLGEEAVGSESLFITDGPRDPSEEDTSMWDLAGLHMHVRHDKKQ